MNNCTLPENGIAPADGQSQNEFHLPTIDFQTVCEFQGGYLPNSFQTLQKEKVIGPPLKFRQFHLRPAFCDISSLTRCKCQGSQWFILAAKMLICEGCFL